MEKEYNIWFSKLKLSNNAKLKLLNHFVTPKNIWNLTEKDLKCISLENEKISEILSVKNRINLENELKYINQEIEITNEGEYMLILCYIKDEKIDDGLDRAYIKDIKLTTELAYALAYDNISNVRNEVIGKKQTTEGGFVIYEGNEEVTDRNKWEAQATRNQWMVMI